MFGIKPILEDKTEEVKKVDCEIIAEQTFMAELREHMNEFAINELDLGGFETGVSEMTKSKANYFVKLYNDACKEEDEINHFCDMEIDRVKRGINDFRESKIKVTSQKKEWLLDILREYARVELEGKKSKTLSLPYGKLSFRSQQPKIDYDEEEVIAFLKEHKPELVTTEIKEKVSKSQLKKESRIESGMLIINDVVVPTATVQDQEDKFEIKL